MKQKRKTNKAEAEADDTSKQNKKKQRHILLDNSITLSNQVIIDTRELRFFAYKYLRKPA